ncbi:hypothetical protein [Rhodococcus koreensis]|uniref:hypothetical protein n=1 Tax=Rhodococcus koreensis TaxID=99653 RepID=UPI00366CF2CC
MTTDSTPDFAAFNYKTVVSAFKPRIATMQPTSMYHGMGMQVQYVYAYLGDEDGNTYLVERKFMGSMTGGAYVMCDEVGALALREETQLTARGELRRKSTPELRRWAEPVLQRAGDKASPAGERPLVVELRDESVLWDEGDILHLEGTPGALGVQAFAPMPESPWFYSSYPSRVEGTVVGRPCKGIMLVETGYWRHGVEPKEAVFYQELERSFNAFGNLLDDGTMQWGYLVNAAQDLQVAVVVEDLNGVGSVVVASNELDCRYQIEDNGQIHYAEQRSGDQVWDFRTDKRGHMVDFEASRWSGYGSMAGITTLRDDPRKVEFGYGWFEYFRDRIPADRRI